MTGLNLTFSPVATDVLLDTAALTSGTFRPANYETAADTFPAPGPGALTDAQGCDATNCTLREAITAAGGNDLINFAPLFNTPQTINLLTASPAIDNSVTIQGTGANLLTVRRDYNAATNFRIFNIAGGISNVAISGQTIPQSAQAIVGNATVVNDVSGSSGGFVTLYPSSAALPTVSNLNYVPGQIVPNSFVVGLGAADGAFNIYATSSINFIVDLTGYFAP